MLFRRPVREIASWPAWEVELLEHYLARQPAPEQRIEIALAQLSAMYANRHRDPQKQPKPVEPMQFMPFHPDPWDRDAEAAAEADWAKSVLMNP